LVFLRGIYFSLDTSAIRTTPGSRCDIDCKS
jgi:hypothetical protein